MRLDGSRCVVRPWRMKDAEALARHANNLDIARQLRDRFPHPYQVDDAYGFLKHVTANAGATSFAIEVGDEAVGGIGFEPGTDVERFSAEIGYWLGEAYWRQGITTQAVMLVTEYAFSRLNLLRMFALPFADNTASARVLEKAGYVREAVLRRSGVKFGQPRDQAIYARVNEQWRSDNLAP